MVPSYERLQNTPDDVPVSLCVDLDGCLVRTDTIIESVLAILVRKPRAIFAIIVWLIHGRAYFKQRVAMAGELDVTALPYNEKVMEYVRQERSKGRAAVLVTATDRKIAQRVAEFTGLFDAVMASEGSVNLKGGNKRDALVARFGEAGFDYIGNGIADIAVFRRARTAIVAGHSLLLNLRLLALPDAAVIELDQPRQAVLRDCAAAVFAALRPLQWTKNLLLLVPLAVAHQLGDQARLRDTLIGVVCFCLAASSGYLINDLLDLNSDRHHPKKQHRALASGALPLAAGIHLGWLTIAAAAVLALYGLNHLFFLVLMLYYAATVCYSVLLKQMLLLDVMILAGLHTLRIVAGGLAAQLRISVWLLAFSMFFFLSLALAKRYSELQKTDLNQASPNARRGYLPADLPQVQALGSASGLVAGLVLALYLNSPECIALYRHPQWLWSLTIVITFWIGRLWFLAGRGILDDDPVMFALTDKVSVIAAALCGVALLLAR